MGAGYFHKLKKKNNPGIQDLENGRTCQIGKRKIGKELLLYIKLSLNPEMSAV